MHSTSAAQLKHKKKKNRTKITQNQKLNKKRGHGVHWEMLNFGKSVVSERNKMGESISHKKGSFQPGTDPLSCISCSVKAEGWKAAAGIHAGHKTKQFIHCAKRSWGYDQETAPGSLGPIAPTLLIYLEQHHNLQKQVFTLLPAPEFSISRIQTRTRNSCFMRMLIIQGQHEKIKRAHVNGNNKTLLLLPQMSHHSHKRP